MMSHAASAPADGGSNIGAGETMFHSSMSWITPSVLTSTAISPPLLFPPVFIFLCDRIVWNPGRDTLESGICSCSHVLVKHIKLHCWNSRFVLVSASSLSILLARHLTFSIMMEGRAGLNLLFLSPRSASAVSSLQFIRDLGSQSGYYLASWSVHHLIPLVNSFLVAMVIHNNRW